MNNAQFPVYSVQGGRGLGGVLTGLGRIAVPLVAPILKSVGRKLLLKGVEALGGSTGSSQRPARTGKRPRRIAGGSVRKKARTKRDIFSRELKK